MGCCEETKLAQLGGCETELVKGLQAAANAALVQGVQEAMVHVNAYLICRFGNGTPAPTPAPQAVSNEIVGIIAGCVLGNLNKLFAKDYVGFFTATVNCVIAKLGDSPPVTPPPAPAPAGRQPRAEDFSTDPRCG